MHEEMSMNVRMSTDRQITLPDDVVEQLHLAPGTEVTFQRGPQGEIILARADPLPRPTREEIRTRLEKFRKWDRAHVLPEYANMTTDEYMKIFRGD
jgi:bifunctional DNA-binding transcriptional regulator/antitoxin component of YhaV-PrlF toxin-antitoxin module